MPRPRSNKSRCNPPRESNNNAIWFNKSVARQRRRNEIAKESRKRNR